MRPADNPFSVSRQHGLKYRFTEGDDWDQFMRRLVTQNWSGALVGKKGTGKTTLLLELEPKLTRLGFGIKHLFLNCKKRKFSRVELNLIMNELTDNDIILFDGSEQMNWWRWQIFLWQTRKSKGLIITVHKPSKLPTILRTSTSFDYFKEIVHELIQNHSNLQNLSTSEQLYNLFEKHGGNIRLALRDLYDLAMKYQ